MGDTTHFQYCQKIVLFSRDMSAVLLARRKGEADYDGVYSLIGGKMETTDGGFNAGLKREKNEEIGASVEIRVCPSVSFNTYYVKKDGNAMVLPHVYAEYLKGDITLSDEYSDFRWVPLTELRSFGPKIENIPDIVECMLKIRASLEDDDFVLI